MILLDIIQYSETRAIEISKFLIANKYALQTHIDTNRILNDEGEVVTVRLFFITKSLLFDVIEKEIRERFFTNELLIYATPVSHVSKEFGEKLRLNLKAA